MTECLDRMKESMKELGDVVWPHDEEEKFNEDEIERITGEIAAAARQHNDELALE